MPNHNPDDPADDGLRKILTKRPLASKGTDLRTGKLDAKPKDAGDSTYPDPPEDRDFDGLVEHSPPPYGEDPKKEGGE